MKTLFAIALLGLLAAVFLWERSAMVGLRVQNEALRAENAEARQLVEQNRELEGLRAAGGSTKRLDRAELLRLRNEVRRLRAQQQDVEKLRAANQRVAEELKSGNFTPRRLADVEGAVPRQKWTFAGFATPEATVQSFFAGVASGEMEQFINCMTPNHAAKMRAELGNEVPGNEDPGEREEFKKILAKMASLSAFRIAQREPRSPDTMVFEIQLTFDGARMPMSLVRVGNEWKLDLDANLEPE